MPGSERVRRRCSRGPARPAARRVLRLDACCRNLPAAAPPYLPYLAICRQHWAPLRNPCRLAYRHRSWLFTRRISGAHLDIQADLAALIP